MLNTYELDDGRRESMAEKMRKRDMAWVYVFSILNYQLHISSRLGQHLTLIPGLLWRKLKCFSLSRNVSSHVQLKASERTNSFGLVYLSVQLSRQEGKIVHTKQAKHNASCSINLSMLSVSSSFPTPLFLFGNTVIIKLNWWWNTWKHLQWGRKQQKDKRRGGKKMKSVGNERLEKEKKVKNVEKCKKVHQQRWGECEDDTEKCENIPPVVVSVLLWKWNTKKSTHIFKRSTSVELQWSCERLRGKKPVKLLWQTKNSQVYISRIKPLCLL